MDDEENGTSSLPARSGNLLEFVELASTLLVWQPRMLRRQLQRCVVFYLRETTTISAADFKLRLNCHFDEASTSYEIRGIVCLPTAWVLCEPFPPGLVSRGNLRHSTLNKVAHYPGGTGLESLRIEKTTLFMKDFLTNPQPCISSVAPSPLVRQITLIARRLAPPAPVDIQHTTVSDLRGLAGFRE